MDKFEYYISKENDEDIHIPIFCDLYSKFVNKEKDEYIFYGYENLLSKYQICKPTELTNLPNFVVDSKLIYFLRFVCISNIIDQTTAFFSSDEIERERLAICQFLRKINVINEDIYFEEIKSITKRLMINNGIREIENSKIYVDEEGIYKSLEKSMKESYIRYQALLICDSSTTDYIIPTKEGYILTISSNEKYNLLKSMYTEIRDEFISNSKFGLDCYLSIGIRHGTLSGQLRRIFEANYLITVKDSYTNKYMDNDYWKDHFSDVIQQDLQVIIKSLNEFSLSVDDQIAKLKDRWIQIKTENKQGDGLFDYIFSDKDIAELALRVDIETPFDTFIDLCFKRLWERTEINLDIIRERLTGAFKQTFIGIFNNLQTLINSYSTIINTVDINRCINSCRTDVLNEIDKIANWFKRVRSIESSDYNIELPINISIEMIRNIYPNRLNDPIITQTFNHILVGKTLKYFVDIIYILLDNIIKHCGYPVCPKVEIQLNAYAQHILNIIISSSISPELITDELEDRIFRIQEYLKEQSYFDNVRREGGSGFFKIKKILLIDVKCDHDIGIYIKDDKFVVELLIDTRGIIYEHFDC